MNMLIKFLMYLQINSKSMTTEKKNKWTVIINTVLTIISAVASALGLGVSPF